MFPTSFLRYAAQNLLIGLAHLRLMAQVQLHAAYVGFVRNGFREKLNHDGIANFARMLHGLVFASRDPRVNRRNPIGREQLLRFELVEQETAVSPRVLNDSSGLFPGSALRIV